ncbi:hypothetical protein IE077_002373 [Cardiosporidium cionae]|uniref:U3 small nucleolar RNA-associated protein 25 n=1 Tax=Cardiosporidium cionae TaxID=476202 RepID=A0ABQ7JFU2_9APIC|nr:hypothetical protein IE077_002373 [Cardiosporidium cionae]|eukprot:KAF8822829.1 hypothetical protein IE077_002373 [Cardiosporidium cionae]
MSKVPLVRKKLKPLEKWSETTLNDEFLPPSKKKLKASPKGEFSNSMLLGIDHNEQTFYDRLLGTLPLANSCDSSLISWSSELLTGEEHYGSSYNSTMKTEGLSNLKGSTRSNTKEKKLHPPAMLDSPISKDLLELCQDDLATEENEYGFKLSSDDEESEIFTDSCTNFSTGLPANIETLASSDAAVTETMPVDFFETFETKLPDDEAHQLKQRIRLVPSQAKIINGSYDSSRSTAVEYLQLTNALYLRSASNPRDSLEDQRVNCTNSLKDRNSIKESRNKSGTKTDRFGMFVSPSGYSTYQYKWGQLPSILRHVLSAQKPSLPQLSKTSQRSNSGVHAYALHPKIVSELLKNSIPSHVMKLLQASNDEVNATKGAALERAEMQNPTFFHCLNSYVDILCTDQTCENSKYLRLLSAIHIVNHMYKCRDLMLKNNNILKTLVAEKQETKLQCKQKHSNDGISNQIANFSRDDKFEELRDQGFARPRVLVITPFRSTAKEIVDFILDFCPSASKLTMNRKRYENEFGVETSEQAKIQEMHAKQKKPADFIELFSGNSNDRLFLGIRFTTKATILFAPAALSDVIIASPLGLRLAIGYTEDKIKDYDFLSSIEIVLADRLDVIRMQNWLHLKDIWQFLNLIPKQSRDFDIRRVRHWNLDGNAACYRQTILLSNGNDVRFNALHNQSANFRGSVKLWNASNGQILRTAAESGIRQMFQRVPCKEFTNSNDAMLHFLEHTALPKFVSNLSGVLLIVPSYVEYVRLWGILKQQNISFRSCHEKSSNKMLSASRQKFFDGECSLLVTTIRFLFYRRYIMRGAQHAIFWAPPAQPLLYQEILQNLESPKGGLSMCYYTQYSAEYLEQIVGNKSLRKLMESPELRITAFK